MTEPRDRLTVAFDRLEAADENGYRRLLRWWLFLWIAYVVIVPGIFATVKLLSR